MISYQVWVSIPSVKSICKNSNLNVCPREWCTAPTCYFKKKITENRRDIPTYFPSLRSTGMFCADVFL